MSRSPREALPIIARRPGLWLASAVLSACMACMQTYREIEWRRIEQCIDQICAVRGTVAAVDRDGPAIRLYFDRESRDVRVLLIRAVFVTWPDYTGREIVVTGPVRRFRDRLEILVRDPDSIEIVSAPTAESARGAPPPDTGAASLDAAASPSPTAPPSPAPQATATYVEGLERRIDELEQRVRELEGR